MIEHLTEEIDDRVLEKHLRERGLEGWIPWSKNASGTPGSNVTHTRVWFWRVKRIAVALFVGLFLVGCMPAFQVNQVPMTIQGKQVVYVAASWHNGQGVNACAIDRYIDGNLVAHDILTNSGLAEMVLPAIVNAVAPVATSVGPYIK